MLDFDVDTSWYIEEDLCLPDVGMTRCCAAQTLTLQLASPQLVLGVVLRGNRDFPTGYDFLTGRLEFLDTNGALITSTPVVFSRPASDWAMSFPLGLANVSSVRLVPGYSESEGGLSEVQLFTP